MMRHLKEDSLCSKFVLSLGSADKKLFLPQEQNWPSNGNGAIIPVLLKVSSNKSILMKIAIYNVNGVNAWLPVWLRWLKATAPDVVCLQELKALRKNFGRDR